MDDLSAGNPENDSRMGAQNAFVDMSSMRSMLLDESRVGRKFGIGQNGNVNLGLAAPLFLPNDMSIIQSSNPSNLRGFNRLGSMIPSDAIGSSSG